MHCEENASVIRRDQARLAKIAELQRLVDEGLASGISIRTPDEIRQLARDRAALSPANRTTII